MAIDIKQVAKLAKLHIEDDKVDSFTQDIEALLAMAAELPPPAGTDVPLDAQDTMLLREDEITPSYPQQDILRNAPQAAEGYFVVPRTVE